MDICSEQFERKLNTSTYWHNKSCDLMVSACVLWDKMEGDFALHVSCSSACKMLMGMSLEALFKAHCIAQKSDNPLMKQSHELSNLANIAGIQFNKSENKILDILSGYIIWDGRYPVPKKLSQAKEHSRKIITTTYDKEKLGNWDVLKPNNALNFNSVNEIWLRVSSSYMEKYNKT